MVGSAALSRSGCRLKPALQALVEFAGEGRWLRFGGEGGWAWCVPRRSRVAGAGQRPALQAVFRARKRQDGAEPQARRRRVRGESVKGGTPPFTKLLLPIGTRRSARSARGSFDCRRAASGGSGTGAQATRSRGTAPRGQCPRPRTARPGCRGAELNRRHKDFQSSALPSELPRLRAPAISRGRGSLAQAQAPCGSASSPSSSPPRPSALRTRTSTSAISGSSSSSVRRVRSRPCPICSPW